jgi:hypothetical protein
MGRRSITLGVDASGDVWFAGEDRGAVATAVEVGAAGDVGAAGEVGAAAGAAADSETQHRPNAQGLHGLEDKRGAYGCR